MSENIHFCVNFLSDQGVIFTKAQWSWSHALMVRVLHSDKHKTWILFIILTDFTFYNDNI